MSMDNLTDNDGETVDAIMARLDEAQVAWVPLVSGILPTLRLRGQK